ncbi:immediate early response gene 5 protein [Acipenser oxyrinchus oxyrinchus]|uniref:Immediate early response gene 5 protein n=1 Tax=Acipenser oxyrinchus oxyrinchus TaxID=40147 RepID=A0AAD8G659_ACIOX|nr:immediate early response gene 5 protein [Acipenser oxyrinchus oxyrinchus]
MEFKVEAHRIMSISLGKIYNSRVQRGGIKLHKNLLVSLVLRSARQVYLNDYYQSVCLNAQQHWGQHEEVMDSDQPKSTSEPAGYTATTPAAPATTIVSEPGLPAENMPPELTIDVESLTESHAAAPTEEAEADHTDSEEDKSSDSDCRRHQPSELKGDSADPVSSPTAVPVAEHLMPDNQIGPKKVEEAKPPQDDGGCGEADAVGGGDGDSETETQLVNHPAASCNRKRRSSEKAAPPESPVKKTKRAPASTPSGEEEMDTTNVSSLITIFGSSFSGLLSKDGTQTEAEAGDSDRDSGAGQICCDQVLKNLNPWTTAIVAF